METWFDIQYTRRHVNRKRAVPDRARVLAISPGASVRFLLATLHRNSRAGVYRVVAVSPADKNNASFQATIRAAKKALRRSKTAACRIELLQAIVRGGKTGRAQLAPVSKSAVEVANEIIPAQTPAAGGILSMQ